MLNQSPYKTQHVMNEYHIESQTSIIKFCNEKKHRNARQEHPLISFTIYSENER